MTLKRSKTAPKCGDDWRSPCAVARTLDILGDKWSMLIIRDLFGKKRRYNEFIESREGITTSVLADRLKRFEEHGIVERRRYQDHPPRYEYVLTEKGRALGPVLRSIVEWGLAHIDGSKAM